MTVFGGLAGVVCAALDLAEPWRLSTPTGTMTVAPVVAAAAAAAAVAGRPGWPVAAPAWRSGEIWHWGTEEEDTIELPKHIIPQMVLDGTCAYLRTVLHGIVGIGSTGRPSSSCTTSLLAHLLHGQLGVARHANARLCVAAHIGELGLERTARGAQYMAAAATMVAPFDEREAQLAAHAGGRVGVRDPIGRNDAELVLLVVVFGLLLVVLVGKGGGWRCGGLVLDRGGQGGIEFVRAGRGHLRHTVDDANFGHSDGGGDLGAAIAGDFFCGGGGDDVHWWRRCLFGGRLIGRTDRWFDRSARLAGGGLAVGGVVVARFRLHRHLVGLMLVDSTVDVDPMVEPFLWCGWVAIQ